LLVPGFTGSKEDFIAVLEPLMTHGYRCLAIDLRGQNESSGPAEEAAYSLSGFGADLVAAAEAFDAEPLHLVGHSFGGLVAQEAVVASPSRWASLTLVCSGPGALPDDHHERTRLFADVLDAHGSEVLWEAMQALDQAQGDAVASDPAIADFLRRRFLRNSPGSLAAMARSLAGAQPRLAEVRAAAVPVHVVTGAEDGWWYPDVQEQMAAALDARFSVLTEVGHSPAVEQPARTVEILTDFWEAG
jgi:pimeloyl-ACP methyl ester carboxylesterase